MDLLTHIFSGAAAATAVAAVAGGRPKRRLGMVAAGAFGGMVPDVDAIGMWSHFDGTFGRLLHLEHTGREIYGMKLWYSHHAFFHSLAAAVLLALLFGLAAWVLTGRRGAVNAFFKKNYVFGVAFVTGYFAHLLGDVPTPASVWGGVDMFWPAHAYVGGTGQVWWWNNYDIFLVVALCAAVNTVLLLLPGRHLRSIVGGVCALALVVVLVQVNTRKYDYAYEGNAPDYAQMEERSKHEQRRILGPRLYKAMKRFDEALPIHF